MQERLGEGTPTPKAPRKVARPLGESLLEAGLITEPQLDLALRAQRRDGGFLGEVLVELGFVTEEDITVCLAREIGVEMISVKELEVDPELLQLVSYETARNHRLIPVERNASQLTVVFADALDVVAQDVVERESKLLIRVATAPEADVLEAIERNYAQSSSINEIIERVLSADQAGEVNVDEDSPMVRLVDQILSAGINQGATDIHIQPEERNLRVRLRVDGMLREEVIIPKTMQAAVVARLKLMANLDITEKRAPQDGRIRFSFGSGTMDFRVSTLPTRNGESVVLRLLDGGAVRLALNDLGFSDSDLDRLEQAIASPFGMVLVTGPTGSGKTTTLYTALGTIDRETRSVFTLEDPIEYSLPLIRQTQVHPEVGMDFAAGLRSLLRQDPDVILVGEIRDGETAELATRAAMTGHLVFSTLHTNSAVGVIPRLIDMGIDRYLLPTSLTCVVGQRLLRRLCQSCRRHVDGPDPLLGGDGGPTGPLAEEHWQPVGCAECGQSGYKGRLGVYEVMPLLPAMHDAILANGSETEILQIARDAGMTSMFEDGLAKAQAGLTSVAEVVRVLR